MCVIMNVMLTFFRISAILVLLKLKVSWSWHPWLWLRLSLSFLPRVVSWSCRRLSRLRYHCWSCLSAYHCWSCLSALLSSFSSLFLYLSFFSLNLPDWSVVAKLFCIHIRSVSVPVRIPVAVSIRVNFWTLAFIPSNIRTSRTTSCNRYIRTSATVSWTRARLGRLAGLSPLHRTWNSILVDS